MKKYIHFLLMKSIITCFGLLFYTVCTGQLTHYGKLYLDADCENKNCLQGKKYDLEEHLFNLHNSYNLTINILIYPKDCKIVQSNDGSQTVLGPEVDGKCNWYNENVDYLLLFRPRTFTFFEHNNPIYLNEHSLKTETQGILNDISYKDYPEKLLCVIQKALNEILAAENSSYPAIDDLCINPSSPDYSNFLPSKEFFGIPDWAVQTITEPDQMPTRLILDYCTPILIDHRYRISNYVFNCAPQREWEKNLPAPEYLHVVFTENVALPLRFNDVVIQKVTNLSYQPGATVNPFSNCPLQLDYLSQSDLDHIKALIEKRDANGESTLRYDNFVTRVREGFNELEAYLLGGVPPKPSLTTCPTCGTSNGPPTFQYCISRDSFSDDFLPDFAGNGSLLSQDPEINENEGIMDFSGLPPIEKEKLKNAVSRINSLYGTQIRFIFSDVNVDPSPSASTGGGSSNYSVPSNYEFDLSFGDINPEPQNDAQQFIENQFSQYGGFPEDIVVWMSYDGLNEKMCFNFYFKEDFFVADSLQIDFSEEGRPMLEKAILNGVTKQYSEFEGVNEFDYPVSVEESDARVWYSGLREGVTKNDLSFWNITGELGGLTKKFFLEGVVDENLWHSQNGQSLFDIPGAGGGIGSALAENNPVGEVLQGLSFIYTITTDCETREATWQALRQPTKLLKAIYEENYASLTGEDIEQRWYTGAKLIGDAFFLCFGGAFISNLDGVDNKASDITSKLDNKTNDNFKIKDDTPGGNGGNPNGGGNPGENIPGTLILIGDSYPHRLNGSIAKKNPTLDPAASKLLKKDFEAFIGTLSEPTKKKVTHHPAFFDIWDRIHAENATIDIEVFVEALEKLPDADNMLFYKKFKENMGLEHWDDVTPQGLEKAEQFLNDVKVANQDFIDNLVLKPDLIRAWEAISGHPQLRVDVDVLESLSKALDDDYLKTLNLDQVITNKWTQHGFSCPTCTSGGKPWINELIDQLDHFKQFKNVDGYQTVLNQLLNQGKTQAIGSHWVMKFTKQKNLFPTKFEDFIDEATGDFSADIIANGKIIECKSWGSKAPGMSNVPNQMINYFNTQTSLSKFEFQFDPERWIPSPLDLNQALKANSNLFDTSKWSNYQQMFQFTNAQVTPNDINGLIDFITTNKFNDIINP